MSATEQGMNRPVVGSYGTTGRRRSTCARSVTWRGRALSRTKKVNSNVDIEWEKSADIQTTAILENQFFTDSFSEKAGLFYVLAVANLRRESAARVILFGLEKFPVMFMNGLVVRCLDWDYQDADL